MQGAVLLTSTPNKWRRRLEKMKTSKHAKSSPSVMTV